MEESPGHERMRRIQAALGRFLTSTAGDRPNYEEATRALFQPDAARFEALVRELYDAVWSRGDLDAIPRLVGPEYMVRWSATGMHHPDLPGFPRSGKRLVFAGQTVYEVKDGRIRGHWQVVDRLGFAEQLRR